MSIVLTRTQNIRPHGNLDKYEFRGSRYGVFDAIYSDGKSPGGIITSDLETKYENAIGSTTEVPVFKFDGSISLGSARAVTVSDAENTTALQTISRTTITWGFKTYPTLFKNNEVGYQEDFAKKYIKFWNLVYSTLDTLGATLLDTYKTQIHADTLAPAYNETSDVVVSPLANELRLLGDVGVMMEANDFFDGLTIVGNGGLQSIWQRSGQFGAGNTQNIAMNLVNKKPFYSTRITNAADHLATFYALNAGSTGFLTGVDREALARTRSKAAGREWDVITDPLFGFKVGSMYYEEDGDFNAIAGAASADMTASHAECWGFSFDYCFVPPYNSSLTTRANPIMKFAVATS